MAVSIDDIGPRLEYQRKGAVWDTIQNNILTLKSQDWISLNIHPTINNYNIWDIDELLDWADDHKISTVINVLHGPERLCIKNLHDVIKEKILEKHGDDRRIHNVLTYMSDNRDPDVVHFISETEFIDNIRNEAFKDIFPEWSKLIYDYM